MLRVLLIALVLNSSMAIAAQLSLSPPPDVANYVITEDCYPSFHVTFQNGVTGIPGIVYWKQIGYRPLTLDLYLPPDSIKIPANGFPFVIYLHGGGFIEGDSQLGGTFVDFPDVLASLSAKGYVVASVNYRFINEAKFPAQIEDVKAAIRWLKLNASKYNINEKHGMVWGVSAGGQLAGLAAVSCHVKALEPKEPIKSFTLNTMDYLVTSSNISDCVQGAVIWFGEFDLSTVTAQSRQDKVIPPLEGALLGCINNKCTAQQLAEASPVSYVGPDNPPMLLIVGTEDSIIPYHQTLEMAEKLKAAGAKYRLILLPGIGHSFVGKTLEQTRDANLKALAHTFEFIDQTIGN